MNLLMKWTLLFATLMMVINSTHAWNIGHKGGTSGPLLHTTYFLTTNNAPFKVAAVAYVGFFTNGVCNYAMNYPMGSETLQTGDVVNFDAFSLKSLVGLGYTCMSLFYTSKQTVIETLQLFSDGLNYTISLPMTSEITII